MPETMTAPPTKRKVEETEQDDDPRRVKLDDPQSVKENTQKSKPKIQAIPRKMRGRIRKAYEKGGRKVSKRGGEDVAEESVKTSIHASAKVSNRTDRVTRYSS